MEYNASDATAFRKPPSRSPFLKALLLVTLIGVLLAAIALLAGSFLSNGDSARRDKIALVEVTGLIADSTETVRQLSDYRKDPAIRGIILRVDSPGGTVAPSQEIYEEVRKVRQDNKKIYVSMGTVAASGGYYIASPADLIVANPGTLTGSIGVIMTFANGEPLMEKLGIKPQVIKSGKFKDIGSFARPMTKEDATVLQHVVDDVYSQFVEAVAQGRQLDIETVKKLADGRIYSGRQAHNLKLVDQLGGLEKTITLMAEELGISGRPRIVREEEEKPFMQWLLQGKLPEGLTKSVFPGSLLKTPSIQYLWTGGVM